jgi:hypothetical protein
VFFYSVSDKWIFHCFYHFKRDDSSIVLVFAVGADEDVLFAADKYLFVVRFVPVFGVFDEEETLFESLYLFLSFRCRVSLCVILADIRL